MILPCAYRRGCLDALGVVCTLHLLFPYSLLLQGFNFLCPPSQLSLHKSLIQVLCVHYDLQPALSNLRFD